MYAVIQSGSRQYRAEAGQLLQVEKLEKKLGEEFELENVVFVGGDKPAAGVPYVKGAKVKVVVTQQTQGPKVLIFKKKRRHGYRRLKGHRQTFTELFVLSISANGETVKADNKPVIIDPAKKAERMALFDALPQEQKREKTAKKTQAKVAKKAAASKKASAKKKAAPKRKKAAAKKTAKKTKK